MKKQIIISAAICQFVICNLQLQAQNIGINTTGATPNTKAMLDIDADAATKSGLLIPRMTTAERNTITAPIPESLLIYNTTTQCFEAWNNTSATWVAFGCIGCTVPTAVTASAAPNPICVGSTLNLTGSATNATAWQWTGPNGFTSTTQSPTIAGITTAGAGVYTLIASNTCASAAPASTASVSVTATAPAAAAGSDINPACGLTTATLAGNNPAPGTGLWTVVSGTATITTPSSPTSGVTGLSVPGTVTLRWTISNAPCATTFDDVVITTTTCCVNTCSNSDTYSSAAGWTQVGTGVSVTAGVANFNNAVNDVDRRIYRPITCTLADCGGWSVDFDYRVTGQSQESHPILGLTAGTAVPMYDYGIPAESNQDGLFVWVSYWCTNPGNSHLSIAAKDGTARSFSFPTNTCITTSFNVTYYCRFQRTSATNVRLSVFSDAARTINIAGSPINFTIPTTITGLNTLQHSNYWSGTAQWFSGWIDNLSIY